MRKFVARNSYIAAERWNGESELFEHLRENFRDLISMPDSSRVGVYTPDGEQIATIGDWIVQDSSGTVFVMKDDIFNRKYKALA